MTIKPSTIVQEVAQLEPTFASLLGCNNGKFIDDDDETSVLLKCTLDLFQSMHLEHPVWHMIGSALHAHHKQFCCGTKTLLILTLWLLQAAEELIARGIPVSDVIDGYHQGFNLCFDHLESLKFDPFPEEEVCTDSKGESTPPSTNDDVIDDDDDVSWFFTDEIEIQSLQDPRQNRQIPASKLELPKFDSILDDFVTKTQNNEGYSSLKNCPEDLDEFDDCFVGTQFEMQVNDSKADLASDASRNDLNLKIENILKSRLKTGVAAKILNQSRHFCSIESSLEENTQRKQSHLPLVDDIESQFQEIALQMNGANVAKTVKDDTLVHNSYSRSELNQKLEDILKSNPKKDSSATILNRSRHFSSIESSLEEHLTNEKQQLPLPMNCDCSSQDSAVQVDNCESNLAKDPVSVMNPTDSATKSNSSNNGKFEYSNEQFLQTFLSQSINGASIENTEVKKDVIWKILHGICRGDEDNVRLLTDLFLQQNEGSLSNIRFQKDFVHFCQASLRSPKWSQAVRGLVVKCSADLSSLVHLRSGMLLRTVFLNGDLTPGYRHAGHKEAVQGHRHGDKVLEQSSEQKWIDKTLHILEDNDINAILVRGRVLPELEIQCFTKGIFVITDIPVKMLQCLATDFCCDLLVYLEDIAMSYISSDVLICNWQPDWITENGSDHFLVIQPERSTFQTLVMCSWNENLTKVKEDSLQHALGRLHNVVENSHCLPGSGITELLCSKQLLEAAGSEGVSLPFHLDNTYRSLASVFRRFFHTIHVNNGYQNISSLDDLICLSKEEVCLYLDDFISKVAAWKGCLHIVKQILFIDFEIITGLEDNTLCYL